MSIKSYIPSSKKPRLHFIPLCSLSRCRSAPELTLRQFSCKPSDSQQPTLARGRAHQSEKSAWCVPDGTENTREKNQSCVPVSLAALFSDERVHIYPLTEFSRWPAAPFFIDPISLVSVVALQASYLSDRACLSGRLPDSVRARVRVLASVCSTVLKRVHMWVGVYYLTWGSKISECKMSQVTYSVSWLPRRPAGETHALFSASLTCTLPPPTHKTEDSYRTGLRRGSSCHVMFLCQRTGS